MDCLTSHFQDRSCVSLAATIIFPRRRGPQGMLPTRHGLQCGRRAALPVVYGPNGSASRRPAPFGDLPCKYTRLRLDAARHNQIFTPGQLLITSAFSALVLDLSGITSMVWPRQAYPWRYVSGQKGSPSGLWREGPQHCRLLLENRYPNADVIASHRPDEIVYDSEFVPAWFDNFLPLC